MFILVYVGAVLDYPEYRHTALFFESPTESTTGSTTASTTASTTLMHVTGAHGFFQFEEVDGYIADQSRTLAKRILVANLPDTLSAASLSAIISNTPVRNRREDADWNCQNWVGDALTRLVSYGHLDASQREAAIDKMVDACLEAKDG